MMSKTIVGCTALSFVLAMGLSVSAQKTRPVDPVTPPGVQPPARGPVAGSGMPVAGRGRGAVPADGVAVAINYTGKGTVNAEHEILLFLFSDPTITADSQPIAMMALPKNGVTATFQHVIASPVFLAAAYDRTGEYHGKTMPPPDGTSFAIFAKDATSAPTPVKPGQPAIKMTFGDAKR